MAPLSLLTMVLLLVSPVWTDQLTFPVGWQFNIVNRQLPQVGFQSSYQLGNSYQGYSYADQYYISPSSLTAYFVQVSELMFSESDYQSQTEKISKTSFGLGLPEVASINFAYTSVQEDTTELFQAGLNVCMQQLIFIPSLKIDLQSSAFLNSNNPLNKELAFLPENCLGSNQSYYSKFPLFGGTHLVVSGYKGAYSTYMSCVSKQFVQQYSTEYVSQQFQYGFKVFNINFGLDTSTSSSSVEKLMNENFQQQMITQAKFYGAYNLTLNNYQGQWLNWSYTAQTNVTQTVFLPYQAVLNPLSDYLMDPTKSACLETAIVDYINTGVVPSGDVETLAEVNTANFGTLELGYNVVKFQFGLPVFALASSGNVIPGTTNLMLPTNAYTYRETESSWYNLSLAFYNVSNMYFGYESYYTQEKFSGSQDFAASVWATEYMEEDYSFCDATKSFITAVVELDPYITALDPQLVEILKYFETKVTSYDYQTFYTYIIQYYGTHVYQTAHVGGRLRWLSYLHNCIIRTESESWFTDQSTKDFGLHTDYDSGYTLDSSYEDTQFRANAFEAIGGTVLMDELTPDNVAAWLLTIPDNSITIGGSLIRLSEVIKLQYPNTSAFLDHAIDDYLKGSSLSDIGRNKLVFPSYPDQWVGDPNCNPCLSTCKGQNACPGETCHYYYDCTYFKWGSTNECPGMSMYQCLNWYTNNGGCSNEMAAHPSSMCTCQGATLSPTSVACGDDCVLY